MTHTVLKHTPARLIGLVGVAAVALSLSACDDGGGPPLDTGDNDTEVRSPNAVVDPCTIDFGTLEPGESKGQTVRVANTGGGPLQIKEVKIIEGEPFVQHAKVPVVAAAGSAYMFNVRFEPKPDDFGIFGDELQITTDDPDEPVIICALSGAVSDDADLDGFIAVEAGGDDCDDSDPTVNPGADEIWYDGRDQDCSGGSDYDQDGDGFDSKVYWEDTETENPDSGQPGGDCQDVDASMFPGNPDEVWYDGKDSNCDGQNDFDQDGDGYRTAEFGYNDCNDKDPAAYPGATEIFNGADDDCNGRTDDKASPETADRKATGQAGDEEVGRSIAIADFDDNGIADILVGTAAYDASGKSARGSVSIFWDNGLEDEDEIGESGDHDVFIEGATSDGQFGYEMISLPDFDGDTKPDLAVSAATEASKAGVVYVFSATSLKTSTKVEDYSLKITGLAGYQMGGGLGAGDIDGDGLSDLAMFGSNATKNFTYMGLHYGSGSALGEIGWTEIDATWSNKCGGPPRYSWYVTTCDGDFTGSSGGDPGGGDHYLNNGHASADFDGDGYDDIVHGDAWSDDGTGTDTGSAWILWGRRAEYSNSNSVYKDTQTVVANGTGTNVHMGAGVGVMPDVDGDGADELLVLQGDKSNLYMLMGGDHLRTSHRDMASEADATFTGVSDFSGVINAGDWTGDGVSDVALVFGGSGAGAKGGGLYLFESREWSGTHNADKSVFGSIVGGDFNESFGMGSPISSADLDDNGTIDLVIGDFLYDNTDETKEAPEGAVFVFYNRSE